MKSFLSKIVGLLLATAVLSTAALAQFGGSSGDGSPLPQPTEPVNDFAGLLRPETVERLNTRIKAFKEKTNPQVVLAVAIVRTTEGRDIFEYSLAVARGWKVGTDKEDNPSALLVIAIDDRKYFTQVSRDLEDELPDGLVGQIQRKYLVPAFRQRDYDRGVSETIDAYMATIAERSGMTEELGAFAAPTKTEKRATSKSSVCSGLVVFVLFILFSLLGSRKGKRRFGGFPVFISYGGGGGGWGGGGGGFGGFGGGDFGGGGAGGDW